MKELKPIEGSLKTFISYARWQVNEGADYHPTLPSALDQAKQALEHLEELKRDYVLLPREIDKNLNQKKCNMITDTLAQPICFGKKKQPQTVHKKWRVLHNILKKEYGLNGTDADVWFCEQRILFGSQGYDWDNMSAWARCIQHGEYE